MNIELAYASVDRTTDEIGKHITDLNKLFSQDFFAEGMPFHEDSIEVLRALEQAWERMLEFAGDLEQCRDELAR